MITCDLGSNTLRILEFDCKRRIRVKEFERVVRTAQNLYKTQMISIESQERIFDALDEASKLFNFSSDDIFCVTTEALRQATNSEEVIKKIKEKFGLKFKIIDGKEEARLTLLGIESGLTDAGLKSDNYVMMDLGGGSTEISFKNAGITLSKSFSFGIVTCAERYKTIENISKKISEDTQQIKEYIQQNSIDLKKYERFVATAGTPTTVAAFMEGMSYSSYDYQKINGKILHVNDFTTALEKLLQLNQDEREFWVGTNRSDLVCAGILIVKNIMNLLGFMQCTVIDNGLREGLAISKCNTKEIYEDIKY